MYHKKYRQALIEEFISKFGTEIQEQANRQQGLRFFEEQSLEDTNRIVSITEDGHMVSGFAPYKKENSRREIPQIIPYEHIHSLIEPFDIIRVFYPYLDRPDTYAIRPALAAPVDSNKFVFMPITSGEHTDPIFRRYEFEIYWKESGLNKPCYLRPNIVKNPEDIVFTKFSIVYGRLTNWDIKKLIKMREIYNKETLTNPIPFLYWLIENRISDTIPLRDGNNNYNPIQSIDDIVRTKTANCVDIAIAGYKMTQRNRREFPQSSIGNIEWVINNHTTEGHIFLVFTYYDKTYILDYDQINFYGDFKPFKSSYEIAGKVYADMVRSNHPDHRIRGLKGDNQKVMILDKEGLETLTNTAKYKDQAEWMSLVGFIYHDKNKRYLEEHYRSFDLIDYADLKGT